MTVTANELSRKEYTGNGATTAFAYDWKIYDQAHLEVYKAGLLQTIGTHYTVSGVGNQAGGNVTFLVAPPSGESVVILPNVPSSQATDYVELSTFPAAAHEDAIDKLTLLVQQTREVLRRTLKFAKTSLKRDADSVDPVANKFLRWNSGATGIDAVDITAITSAVLTLLNMVTGGVVFASGSTTIETDSATFFWNNTTKELKVKLLKVAPDEAVTGSDFLVTANEAKLTRHSSDVNQGTLTVKKTRAGSNIVTNDILGDLALNGVTGGTEKQFVVIRGTATDATSTSEDAQLDVRLMRAGIAEVFERLLVPGDGETALLIMRNVAGAFTLQRVSMGAVDSGGAGFKLLRVPN